MVVKRRKAIPNDQVEDKPRDNGEIVDQDSTSNPSAALDIHHTSTKNLKNKLSPQNTHNLPLGSRRDAHEIPNLNDWNFLKKDARKSRNNIPEDQKKTRTDWMFDFIEKLNSQEGYSQKDKILSTIACKKAALILKMYDKCKEKFPYPSGMHRNGRQAVVLKNILWISREKLELGRFRDGFEKNLLALVTGLQSRKRNSSKEILRFDSKTSLILEYVSKINIITTSLAVLYLALFQEHGEGGLTKEFVQAVLDFLKDFWTKIDKGDNADLQKRIFAQHLHRLLSLEEEDLDLGHKNMPQCIMAVSWNIIEYWSEIKYPKLEVSGRKDYRVSMTEIINKIIFFSDYEL
ncbi:hypothetical protein PGT21_007502 [Puccinia graminis f. sp. tritici]|nr:hypothetical protein PGT21_007502 [Puccinia graminis f. sp. tritici]